MGISAFLKETPDDRAVKDRLWLSIKSEATRFAGRYAEEHVRGKRETESQYNVTRAAKANGYPAGLIRDLGSIVRRGITDSPAADAIFDQYKAKIGLLHSQGKL